MLDVGFDFSIGGFMRFWINGLLLLLLLSPSVPGQSPSYPPDALKVTVLDESGALWKSFDRPPFPAVKDIPFKDGKILTYRRGRLPEIMDLANGRLSAVPWIREEVLAHVSVSRCDTLEPQTFKLEAVPVILPDAMKPLAPFLCAETATDGKGIGEFILPRGRYALKSSDGRFLFPDGELIVPDRERKVTALLAHPAEVRTQDEKGTLVEGCRMVYSIRMNPYGRACTAFSIEGGWSGSPATAILPVNGKLSVYAWCPGLLAFSRDVDLRNTGSILVLEGERTGTIEGDVKDEAGNPLKETVIALYKKGGLFPLNTIRTDAQGTFRFEGLGSGAYLITDSARYEAKDYLENAPRKIIPVMGKTGDQAGAADKDFLLTALPPPEGNEIEKIVELEKGKTVHLNFELGRERTWDGRVVDRGGRLLEGTGITCDGTEAVSGTKGRFHIKVRKARLDSCSFHKEGYRPFEIKDVNPDNAPLEVTLSGTAVFQAEIRIPAGMPFVSPPGIQFIKEGKPAGASVTMGIKMENAGTVMDVKAELEDGPCILSVRGTGFKPYVSKPFTLTAGQAYAFGVVNLEAGTGEDPPRQESGSITVFLTDRAGTPVQDAPLAVLETRYDRPEPSVSAAHTDEEGMKVFDGSREFMNLYSDGPRGFLFADGPALAACNNNRTCRFSLNPPNSLVVAIRSLEPGADAFEITVTTPIAIARQTVQRGQSATFTNLASPADITIRVEGKEIFSTRMDVKDGENALDL